VKTQPRKAGFSYNPKIYPKLGIGLGNLKHIFVYNKLYMKTILTFLMVLFLIPMGIAAQPNKKTKPASKVVKPRLYNGIKLVATGGIKVKEARLYYNETGDTVANDNTIKLNEKIVLLIETEDNSFFKKRDTAVLVGAKEVIKTDKGKVVLASDDLFASFTEISAEDAKYISLKAVITKTAAPIEFFIVEFSLWDKWGKGKITGSYKFKVVPEEVEERE
jgi:preprotein translocase subunit YajC